VEGKEGLDGPTYAALFVSGKKARAGALKGEEISFRDGTKRNEKRKRNW